MLTVTDVELRVGARLLMDEVNFRVDKGDKVGLVGRNGAGKTTLTKVLAGGGQPTAGTVTRTGRIGYLPQDPKVEDMDQSGRDRILSARDLDQTIRRMREAEAGMAAVDDAERERAMNRYSRLEAEFEARGGYAAESEAARITSNLGLPDRVLDQPLHTLSGGQRRRVELARILFSDADIMLLDEPTNHLDHDSIVWLRDYLKTYSGGLLMISHDVELMEMTVNKVLYLDANRQTMDVYNMTWKNYLAQRQQDEARRRREFANAEKKASALMAQAEKMRAKATKATAAQNMIKRAERLMRGVEGERAVDRVAAIRFPTPQASGKTPLRAENLSKSYGSLEIFTGVDLAIDRGSRVVILGYNGVINSSLTGLGIIDEPLTFILYNVNSIVITLAHAYAPFAILPIYIALEKIDRSLLEAGRDLGESRAMTFWRVTLPLAMPGVLAAVLIVFIPTIGDYVTPTIIGGGKIPMVANLIQAQMLDIDNKPLGSAIAITAMLIVTLLALVFLFLNRRFLKVRA